MACVHFDSTVQLQPRQQTLSIILFETLNKQLQNLDDFAALQRCWLLTQTLSGQLENIETNKVTFIYICHRVECWLNSNKSE